ncbi:hypothetical protein EJ04DRAFT_71514 [Polyplosphaeria fusca]|uniref:Uncharacterized protein n=1 Tax=Polyplosphaeria fusca TaxID=682080 RepID=A0A9P4R7H3_9PLEO|nr:hypothetical protein EJ04DRAFT_71514 [Polyplosphaeria fusca]
MNALVPVGCMPQSDLPRFAGTHHTSGANDAERAAASANQLLLLSKSISINMSAWLCIASSLNGTPSHLQNTCCFLPAPQPAPRCPTGSWCGRHMGNPAKAPAMSLVDTLP